LIILMNFILRIFAFLGALAPDGFRQVQNSLCNQVLHSPTLAALLQVLSMIFEVDDYTKITANAREFVMLLHYNY